MTVRGGPIAALVLMIIWSYRIAGNLQKLGRAPITWKPGLTIVVWLLGGCTLNIINMLMLGEHWRGSDPEVPPHQAGWRDRPQSPLITVWFALGIANVVVGIASGLNSFSGVGVGNNTDTIATSLSERLPLVIASGDAPKQCTERAHAVLASGQAARALEAWREAARRVKGS